MKTLFFSVIIPVFNASATLGNCLVRIFNSGFKDFEVIIVDDNSSDNSLDIARGFNCRIVGLKDNKGEGNARNEGSEIALGEYLFFIDSDIYVEKDTLQIVYDRIKKDNSDCVSAVYNTKSLYQDVFSAFKHLYDVNYMLGLTGEGNQFCCSAVAVRKEAFEKTGGFNSEFRCNADRDLSFRLRNSGYSIYHESKAKILHDKRYSLIKLFKTSFNRGFYSTAVYRSLGKMRKKLSGAQTGYIIGMFLIPSMILAFLFFSVKTAFILFFLILYRSL